MARRRKQSLRIKKLSRKPTLAQQRAFTRKFFFGKDDTAKKLKGFWYEPHGIFHRLRQARNAEYEKALRAALESNPKYKKLMKGAKK